MSSSSTSSLLQNSMLCFVCLIAAASVTLGLAITPKLSQSPQLLNTVPLRLRIAHCRQRCYRQALLQHMPPALCTSAPDCYMCHDYCRVLVVAEWSLASSMCADRVFCSRGCRIACKYHRLRTADAAWTPNVLEKGSAP